MPYTPKTGVPEIDVAVATANIGVAAYQRFSPYWTGAKDAATQANDNAQHAWDAANAATIAADNAKISSDAAAAAGASAAAAVDGIPGAVWLQTVHSPGFAVSEAVDYGQIMGYLIEFLTSPVSDEPLGPIGDHDRAVRGTVDGIASRALGAQSAAGFAQFAADNALSRINDLLPGLTRYSLDADGVALFNEDVASGKIAGAGLFVIYTAGEAVEPVLCLNPLLLTFTSPSGGEVFNLPEVLIDMLAATQLYALKSD